MKININKGVCIKLLAGSLCIFLSAALIVRGHCWNREGKDYLQNLTIQSDENGFSAPWLQSALSEKAEGDEREDSAGENTFAAWREQKGETIYGQSSGRNSSGDVIAIYGPSRCLLPIGKNLALSDEKGCIIGSELAEKLFGSFSAEGQKIKWRDGTWTVRGIVREPANMLMVQAGGLPNWTEKLHFDRISIPLKDGQDRKLVGENFILQNNLSAWMLRWDYLHGFSWIWEMVPGEWSDFDGWKQNFREYGKAVSLAKNTDRSSIEAWGLECQKRGGRCALCGVFLLIAGLMLVIPKNRSLIPPLQNLLT